MAECCVCDKGGGAEGSVLLEESAPWHVRQCARCGLVYLDERVQQEGFVAAAAEKEVEYWSFPQMYDRHRKVFEGYFAERWERLQAYCAGLQGALDIGCGFGFFMRYLAERGVEVRGLDIEGESVDYARGELGLEVEQVSFADYETERQFDAIVACDVLEHVDEPVEFLRKCGGLLNEGGVLYVQVPNVLGDVLPTDGSFNWPYHVWQFNADTLGRLMRRGGFEVCQWWTGVMGVIGVYEAGGPDEATRAMWEQARREKRGNRLQMLARPRQ